MIGKWRLFCLQLNVLAFFGNLAPFDDNDQDTISIQAHVKTLKDDIMIALVIWWFNTNES